MKKILVIEDEKKIADVIRSYLIHERYEVDVTDRGEEGLRMHQEHSYDLIILDLMLPGISGEETCKRLRLLSRVSIIMLTAKTSEKDILTGFDYGADDYVTKPFAPKELVARVKAVLRRLTNDELLANQIFLHDGLIIDCRSHVVRKNGEQIGLTPTEYKLLVILAANPKRTFSREDLVEKVLGYDFEGDARAVDSHIKNLRKKIESDPKHPHLIVSVYGSGYRLGDVQG